MKIRVHERGPEVLLWEVSPDRYWETRLREAVVGDRRG